VLVLVPWASMPSWRTTSSGMASPSAGTVPFSRFERGDSHDTGCLHRVRVPHSRGVGPVENSPMTALPEDQDVRSLGPHSIPRFTAAAPHHGEDSANHDARAAVTWEDCYGRTQELSPKAAKLAARMLRRDPLVPYTWDFSLQIALMQRASGNLPFTPEDLSAIAANQRTAEKLLGLTVDQVQAWEFATWVRQVAADQPTVD
jgi:hypothetical protein